ncbi:MAG TPA: nuclear transport factor 2 family protein [Xanthomonadales bacterium]|nr:nuclear transport factor 2 family protein [Xanthomonadales bacterium]
MKHRNLMHYLVLSLALITAFSALPAWADTDEEKLATAQKMVDAWNRTDWEAVYALFSEDAVMHSMMMEPVVGRENIRARFSRFTPGVERIELQLARIGIIDGAVVMERVDDFVYKGKHSRVPVAGVMEIDNGLVTEWREYYDHHQLAESLTTDEVLAERAAKTEQTIRDLTTKLQTDWNGGDMEAYLAAYWNSNDFSLLYGDQAKRGWNAVAEMFRGAWSTEEAMGDFTASDVVVRQIGPGIAVSSGGFTHVFPTETIEGSFSHVWKQLEDGSWVIAHEHTSRKNTH